MENLKAGDKILRIAPDYGAVKCGKIYTFKDYFDESRRDLIIEDCYVAYKTSFFKAIDISIFNELGD